jgi:hypothetical protein
MRTSMLVVVGVVAISSVLGGCGKKEPRTVAYYTANEAERAKVVAECKNNPGGLKDDPDCMNASASIIQGWGKKPLSPINYGTQPASAASK